MMTYALPKKSFLTLSYSLTLLEFSFRPLFFQPRNEIPMYIKSILLKVVFIRLALLSIQLDHFRLIEAVVHKSIETWIMQSKIGHCLRPLFAHISHIFLDRFHIYDLPSLFISVPQKTLLFSTLKEQKDIQLD